MNRLFVDVAPGVNPQDFDFVAFLNIDDPIPPHPETERILDDLPFQLSDIALVGQFPNGFDDDRSRLELALREDT